MRRRMLWFSVAALGIVALLAAGIWWEDIRFYKNLFDAYRSGRRFYSNYPHLARDIAFHPDMQPLLDVYSPPAGDDHPVLIFVHGGSWTAYDRKLFAPVASELTPRGIVVVIPDYTLYPDALYDQMAHEVVAAVAWTLEHIGEYGGDPARVVLAGHSAGGHLAGLVVTNPEYLSAYGHRVEEICGFIGLSGVYDMAAQAAYEQEKGRSIGLLAGVAGGEDRLAEASPSSYASENLPPVLLIHGGQDETVPVSMSEAFQATLEMIGAKSRLLVYTEAGHTDYLFEALNDERAPLPSDLADFVEACGPARSIP